VWPDAIVGLSPGLHKHLRLVQCVQHFSVQKLVPQREELRDTLELSKALKDNYLAASPEKRGKLNKLMFITVNISYEDRPVMPSGQEDNFTVAPFYFV
jgi:hypothetical protein